MWLRRPFFAAATNVSSAEMTTEDSKTDGIKLAGAAAVLAFLRAGAAECRVTGAEILLTSRPLGRSISVSETSLRLLTGKGLVCRSGTTLRLKGKAEAGQAGHETAPTRIDDEGRDGLLQRVKVECPLDYLASLKDKSGRAFIDQDQWAAGDRLRADFTRAQMMPGISMRWEPKTSGGGQAHGGSLNQTEAALAARRRFERALDQVGPELSGLLVDVCCFLKGFQTVETERQWPARSAKLLLRIGLSILARHYAPPVQRRQTVRHWGSSDFRPQL
jgi:hypothetical protein